ncbi:hypothetical protein [Nitrobacter sp. TKz-YC02]|uniref:hypothetical protein n=1 Tax=Nitrobacter sp. TKz-YC02 TaxID=3398704 RepID=UPI003CEDC22B
MTAIPLPMISAPGLNSQTSGGRIVNAYMEKLSATAGQKYAYWRAPGLKLFKAITGTNFRGDLVVGSLLYVVVDDKAYSITSGGTVTQMTGTVSGSAGVFMARNNASTPDIVVVSPGDGAKVIASGAVSSYPDADVGQPNSVVFHKGYFCFTYGDGKSRTSGINSTSVATTDVATAESKPDSLLRAIPLGNGQIVLCGDASMEVWGGQNDTGFPWSYIATIPRGIIGPYAIAGHEDGFGKGIFFCGDDFGVHTLNGYATVKISPPDLDRAIEAETNKEAIRVSVFIAGGRSFVVVQGEAWCWCYDVGEQTWHERESYLVKYWRACFPVKAFGKWLCGDLKTGDLLEISMAEQTEVGDPLRMRIETGPAGAFPQKVRINSIELYLTKGVGEAEGIDPVETDPDIEISMSRDGGNNWLDPRVVKIGRQAVTNRRVRASIWGQADVQGTRWRFDMSSSVPFALMGADMAVDVLR